jgi:hypothetical protein
MNQEHQFYRKALGGLLPDPESIRRTALKQVEHGRPRKRLRWILPAAACLVAIAVICAAIPPVRAAIAKWFTVNHSVEDYLAQPESARPSTPELETMIAQTMPEDKTASNSIEIAGIAPEWQAWADKLRPTIGDVLFDGQKLMVSFDMGGGAGELVLGGCLGEKDTSFPVGISFNNPGYVIMNGEKYGYGAGTDMASSEYESYMSCIGEDGRLSEEGKTLAETDDSVPFTVTIDLTRATENFLADIDSLTQGLTKEEKEAQLETIARLEEYDPDFTSEEYQTPPAELTGVQQVEVHLPLVATDFSTPSKVDEDGIYYSGEIIGMVKLCFSFDPAAGYANVNSYEIKQTGEFKGEVTYAWADWESDPDYATFVNKTIDMAGVEVTVKRVECFATGAELYVSLTCPDDWNELDKRCFLSSLIPTVSGDGEVLPVSGEQYGLEEAGEDQGMCIHLKMLPSEVAAVDSFKIGWMLEHYTGYDDLPYVEGQPTRIKKDEVDGWQADSEELVGCAVSFTLKK